MDLKLFSVFLVLFAVFSFSFAKPVPDSAGHVPQPPGLSYGGIPYGSISGQLSLFFGDYEPIILTTEKEIGNEIEDD